MSTPSMLLLGASAAASLAAVWTLAGLSESSTARYAPRVIAATAIGILGDAVVYGRTAAELRGELSLPLLFSITSVIAMAVGAAKIEGALLDKDGPRVIRRATGLVSGTFFGMAAVGASSLDLSQSSLLHARAGWSLMFALVAASIVVFWQRARYAGAGLLALGQRALVLGLIVVALLVGARLTVAATRVEVSNPAPQAPPGVVVVQPVPEAAPSVVAAPSPALSSSAPAAAVPAPSAIASVPPAASAAQAPSGGTPGELQIDAITTRGLLEADARGGVQRRKDRLQACLTEPKNQQSGTLTLKVGIDPSGSVTYSRATGGDLIGTPLATCLLPVFYKMGFAAPASGNAGFDITLRAP